MLMIEKVVKAGWVPFLIYFKWPKEHGSLNFRWFRRAQMQTTACITEQGNPICHCLFSWFTFSIWRNSHADPSQEKWGGVEPDGRASLAKARHVSSRPHDMLPASHFKGVAKTFGCAHCQGHCHYLLFPFVPKAILAVCWFLLATRSIPLRILTKRSEGVWVSINLELCQSIAMREREREEKERKRERGKRERTN